MPTSFLGLFLFSTALALGATFTALAVQGLIRRLSCVDYGPRHLR